MKLSNLILGLAISSISMVSCDYVDQPLGGDDGTSNTTCCDTIVNFTGNGSTHRNLLIEDFTGHKCPNCPYAGFLINQQKAVYADSIVVVSIHPDVDPLTTPSPVGSGQYETDFRIQAGIDYFNDFGLPTSLPQIMISRIENGSSGYGYGYFQIGTYISSMVGQAADFAIQTEAQVTDCDGESIICGKTQVDVLNGGSGEYRLVHYLVEDSIIDWQQINPSILSNFPECNGHEHCEHFHHHHVLRAVDKTYGNEIFNGTITAGDQSQNIFNFQNLDASWNLSEMYIVTYVKDASSNQGEVLQVIETKVTQ